MAKESITRALTETPISAIITCRPEDERGVPKAELSVKYQYPKKVIPSSIPAERVRGLETLFYKNPRKAIEELIQYRFLEKEITGFYEGDASVILPTRYQQFYRQCTSFETRGYQIYFNDYAIPVFKNTILKLEERSKQDSFLFLKRKIESGESRNLHLTVSDRYANTRSRMCMQLENKKGLASAGEPGLYYHTCLKEDGNLDTGDLENILRLIEVFVENYGEFETIQHTDIECNGYNVGNLKVRGIDKIPELYQKVYSLGKKGE